MKGWGFFAFILICVGTKTFADLTPAYPSSPIITDGSFASPDGRYAFQFGGYYNREDHFDIKDLKTGRVIPLAEPDYDILDPIFVVSWTGDSKTVLLVCHAAESTVPQALHFNGTRWIFYFTLAPPDFESDRMEVQSQKLGQSRISLSISETLLGHNGSKGQNFEYTFLFDPGTNRYLGVKYHPITDEQVWRGREIH
jgi:hypothetical protein